MSTQHLHIFIWSSNSSIKRDHLSLFDWVTWPIVQLRLRSVVGYSTEFFWVTIYRIRNKYYFDSQASIDGYASGGERQSMLGRLSGASKYILVDRSPSCAWLWKLPQHFDGSTRMLGPMDHGNLDLKGAGNSLVSYRI